MTIDNTNVEKHVGERFYCFHNARLYDENGTQVASVQDPVFISFDITDEIASGKSEERLKELNNEMHKEHGFSPAIIAEEDGKTYAVFQMFDDERTAYEYLKKELTLAWGEDVKDTFGIFERIINRYEADVETKDGIVTMKGKYVDNFYLKRTKGIIS